jgi:hypothetical protein
VRRYWTVMNIEPFDQKGTYDLPAPARDIGLGPVVDVPRGSWLALMETWRRRAELISIGGTPIECDLCKDEGVVMRERGVWDPCPACVRLDNTA